MNKIKWTDEFSVGVNSLDEQHKKLIGIINQLIEHHDDANSSGDISPFLTEMLEYAFTHFCDEEQLLLEHDYPGHPKQMEQHKAFWRKPRPSAPPAFWEKKRRQAGL